MAQLLLNSIQFDAPIACLIEVDKATGKFQFLQMDSKELGTILQSVTPTNYPNGSKGIDELITMSYYTRCEQMEFTGRRHGKKYIFESTNVLKQKRVV